MSVVSVCPILVSQSGEKGNGRYFYNLLNTFAQENKWRLGIDKRGIMLKEYQLAANKKGLLREWFKYIYIRNPSKYFCFVDTDTCVDFKEAVIQVAYRKMDGRLIFAWEKEDYVAPPEILVLDREEAITLLFSDRPAQTTKIDKVEKFIQTVGGNMAIKETSAAGDVINVASSSNINVKSTLNDVQQLVNKSGAGSEIERRELESLIKLLGDVLQKVPPDRAEHAEAVAAQASQLMNAAASEKPNRTMLKLVSNSLKQAAEFVSDVVPATVTITEQIVKLVGQIHSEAV